MGLVAGLAVKGSLSRGELTYGRSLLGAACGCAAYYVLYFTKCFLYDGILLEGLQPMVALGILPLKLPASIFNAAVALVAAPPLALAIRRALRNSGLSVPSGS